MPSIDKLFDKAEKLLKKQRYDSALEVFAEIHQSDPEDESVLLNLGELSLKINRPADALRYWALLIDLYTKRSDFSKAIATCRKALKTDPNSIETSARLSELLDKTNRTTEALAAYRETLDRYRKSGDTARAVACLQRIVSLDSSNIQARVELGDLAEASGQPATAAASLLEAADLVRGGGEETRWAQLVERAYNLDPTSETVCIRAAELFLAKNLPSEVIALLEPITQARPDDMVVLDYLSRAYVGVGEYAKAEPLSVRLFQAHPSSTVLIEQIVQGLARTGETEKALQLIGLAKAEFYKQGRQKEFLVLFERLHEADQANLKVLEILTTLYSDVNREEGLRRSLTRLFNLYLAHEQYDQAADTLDRIIDVDPYGPGHQDRLLNLEGHIDPVLYRNIASRIQAPAASRTTEPEGAQVLTKPAAKVEPIEGLIVEGEMYHQYHLAVKLKETLTKIDQLYPGAHEANPRLLELYEAAGFTPTPVRTLSPQKTAAEAAPDALPNSFEELGKIPAITASIHREGAPERVMHVAADKLGQALRAHRCWGALGTPNPPPALITEYCAPEVAPSDPATATQVYTFLMRNANANPEGWSADDVMESAFLGPVATELWKLGIASLLAAPLLDKEEPVGLILVEQCGAPRVWSAGEKMLLKTIAPQVAIAVNDAKLRRLVRSLAGADSATGLLPRASYIDCLLAEASRAKEQSQPVSVCLIEPAGASGLAAELGEARMRAFLQQVSMALSSHLRQNDMAIRYGPYTIAVCFPNTELGKARLAINKLQSVLSHVKSDDNNSPQFCAALCDFHLDSGFDAVDGVTDVINRLEVSMEAVRKEGGPCVHTSNFED